MVFNVWIGGGGLFGDADDAAGDARARVAGGQTAVVALEAQVVLELVQHHGAAYDAERPIQLAQLVGERGVYLAVLVHHVAVVAHVSRVGVNVAVRLVQRVEVRSGRPANFKSQYI